MTLTIVAHITAETGKEDLVRSALEKLVAPTRAEDGCLQYDLHQDNTNPAHFMFFEIWATRDLWQAHLGTPHIAANRVATQGAVRELAVSEMSKIA